MKERCILKVIELASVLVKGQHPRGNRGEDVSALVSAVSRELSLSLYVLYLRRHVAAAD